MVVFLKKEKNNRTQFYHFKSKQMFFSDQKTSEYYFRYTYSMYIVEQKTADQVCKKYEKKERKLDDGNPRYLPQMLRMCRDNFPIFSLLCKVRLHSFDTKKIELIKAANKIFMWIFLEYVQIGACLPHKKTTFVGTDTITIRIMV